MEKQKIIDAGKIIIIVLFVIGLGLFALNQTLNFFYKSEFLQKPCDLCQKLNTNLTLCYKPIVKELENEEIINNLKNINLSQISFGN